MSYVSFNHLSDRFSEQIYNTRKGRLRMQLIDALYQEYLPKEIRGSSVLDAAGGLGQMTHWFLQRQATVDYFDVSEAMVDRVNGEFVRDIENGQLRTQCCAIDEYRCATQFDVVNAHAVLEWLENPVDALIQLAGLVKPGGYIGLMVYNIHMLMLRHMMRGTLSRAMSGKIAGDKRGLTPISPLDPADIASQLNSLGFNILCQAGIRSFSDLAEKTVIDWYEEADVFKSELSLCRKAPYRDMARYVLFIAQKSPFQP